MAEADKNIFADNKDHAPANLQLVNSNEAKLAGTSERKIRMEFSNRSPDKLNSI